MFKPIFPPSKVTLKQHEPHIIISGSSQLLTYTSPTTKKHFHISTAKNGFGETLNSFKTPRGWHYIRATIGMGVATNTCFLGRRAHLDTNISGRIMWLRGLESFNHDPHIHSMLRYIYIHGTPLPFKTRPISQGCINMRNQDIVQLSLIIPSYCKVFIEEV
jgi:hypothetical protein